MNIPIALSKWEWNEIAFILEFASREAEQIGFTTTQSNAQIFADLITNHVKEF
jgi:hypothetical protein